MQKKYKKIYTLKTNVLNSFRFYLIDTAFEKWIAKIIRNNHIISPLLKRFIPNNYQYSKPTIRNFTYNEMFFEVDISDYIGHSVFFGLNSDLYNLFNLCEVDSVVFDIGVNLGWTVINMGKICSKGHVYGFEPDSTNFIACSNNLKLNQDIKNITLTKVALGDQDAFVKMIISEPSNLGGNRVEESSINSTDADVIMTTLDSFFTNKLIDRLDLVKIDTEGYELRILKGGFNTLSRFHPKLFIEINDQNLRRNGDSAEDLIKYLFEIGYSKIINSDTGIEVQSGDDFSNIHMDVIAKI